MVNLKVTAHMGSPLVGDPTFPLDGMLLYHAAIQAYGEPPVAQRPNQPLHFNPLIVPVEILQDGDMWFYSCSFAQYERGYIESTDFVNKRMDMMIVDDYAVTKSVPNTQSGKYKAMHQLYTYRSTPEVTWYVNATDRALFEQLLHQITGIGKETNIGHGLVNAWVVEEICCDYSVARDGLATRALPANFAKSIGVKGRRSIRTIRPPYWDAKSYTEVVF